MPSFSYIAIDAEGKEKKGTIDMPTREDAELWVKQNGLIIISVADSHALSKDVSLKIFEKKPKPRDMAVFCRQFVSIINAGVSIRESLEMLAEQTENKVLRRAIDEARQGVTRGESLADSMRLNRNVFTDIFITMVEAGEASGSLDVSFTRMGEQFEKGARIQNMVKRATTYPIVIAVVMVAVVILMLVFIVPTFEEMFTEMGEELPALTIAVVNASDFMVKYWYIVAAVIFAAAVLIGNFSRTNAGKLFFGRIAIKLPLFGKLTVKTACSRMSRTLSTLIAAGIPLIDAIDITSNTMSNIYFKNALLDAKDDVAMGTALSEPLQRGGLFPPLVYHMLKIGEETGSIEEMLTKMADYYDEEVEASTAQLAAAMEPMVIVVMALIIGTLIIAVLSPMVGMYDALDRL